MRKKIIITAIISILSVLGLEYVFIKTASPITLLRIAKKIRGNRQEADNTKQKDTTKKSVSSLKIESIKTGYLLWKPCVRIKVKNTSSKELKDNNEFKVIFVKNGSVYKQITETATSSYKSLPSKLSKEIELYDVFSKPIIEELMKKRRSLIDYKLYLNDNLIQEGKVKYIDIKKGCKPFKGMR